MIPEIGHFLLWLAMGVALASKYGGHNANVADFSGTLFSLQVFLGLLALTGLLQA